MHGRKRRTRAARGHRPGLGLVAAALAGIAVTGCNPRSPESPSGEGAGRGSAGAQGGGATERLAALAAASPRATRTALLVGIDRYAEGTDRAFPDLSGCENDVERMRDLLVTRFDFPPEEVFSLLNEEATHENIVRAFEKVFLDRADEGTEAVFYLSGHGSRIPDESGYAPAEPDRLDSTYLAHDSRAQGRDGERDLSDDELRSLASALCAKTRNVTVITDSCHAGGTLRGAAPMGTRAAPPGKRGLDREWARSFWPRGIALVEDGPDIELAPLEYVHVAACRRDQVAYEVTHPDEDGRPRTHGALTLHLSVALERAQPGDTWRAVVDDAAARLAAEVPAQTVTYAGAIDRVLFGGEFRPIEGFPARELSGGEMLVHAGVFLGVRPGSVLSVRGLSGEPLGRIRIERASVDRARGSWIEPRPQGELEGMRLRAVEKERPEGEPPFLVEVGAPDLAPLAEGCAEARVASDGGEVVLERSATGGLILRTPEGLPVATLPSPEDDPASCMEELSRALREELRWRALVRLGGERGDLRLRASFRLPRESELAPHPDYVPIEILGDPIGGEGEGRELAANREVEVRAPGEGSKRMGVIAVENAGDEGVYVAVLSIAEDRSRTLIHPSGAGASTLLPAGESLAVKTGIVLPGSWPLARPMRDRYLAIATTRPVDFSLLERPGALRSGERAAPEILQAAFQAAVTRGSSFSVDRSGFGIAALDVLVHPPGR